MQSARPLTVIDQLTRTPPGGIISGINKACDTNHNQTDHADNAISRFLSRSAHFELISKGMA